MSALPEPLPDDLLPDAPEGAAPQVMTFGCRLNAYESEVIRRQAAAAGLSDAVIINTCAVTAEAERQARQTIRRARRDNPGAMIVVTGCAAQLNPEGFAEMPEVDRVLGNEAKLRMESYARELDSPVVVEDIMQAEETASHLIAGFTEKTRAFVQIQQGCDHRCTFCIIPFARGNNRSTPIGEIVRQVRLLVEGGVREVVLTGVDITDYGRDLPGKPSLGQLSRRLLALVPELPRLRLSSIDPSEVDEDVFRLLESEPRLMPHLHLSLQAGHDMTLKRMKRRHLMADAHRTVARAKALRPDLVLGADLIAGFPTESEEMFAGSLDAVEALDLTYLHVFPYSERPGTPAAKMPQVAKPIRKERARLLREAGRRRLHAFLKAQVGRVAEVLIEEETAEGGLIGRSEHFAQVRLPQRGKGEPRGEPGAEPGAILPVRILARDDEVLLGEISEKQSEAS